MATNGRIARGKPETGRVVIKSNATPKATPLSSYFFGITIPQTTIRIRIPRLLAKTFQRRGDGCSDGSNDYTGKNKKKRKKKKVTWGTRKVGSMLSGVFVKKNSPGYYKVRESDDGESEILRKVGSDDDDDKPLGVAPESPSFISFAFKGEERPEMVNKAKKRSMADELFGIRTRFKSTRGEMNGKDAGAGGGLGCGCINVDKFAGMLGPDDQAVILRTNGVSSIPNSASTTDGFVSGRPQKGSNSSGIRSKVLTLRRKLKMVRSARKMPRRQSEEGKQEQCDGEGGEDGGGEELCKKRILMGERCKPLHSLQYDRDGRLLPEIIL